MELYALVIDADARERSIVRNALKSHEWEVSEAASSDAALCFARERTTWGLVFCDADLSTQRVDSSGELTLLGKLKRQCGEGALIAITAEEGRPITALDAILNGASEYLRKPLQEEQIVELSHLVIERLRAINKEDVERRGSLTASEQMIAAPEFVGESKSIIKVFRDLARIVSGIRHDEAHRDRVRRDIVPQTSVFISGETGTGKELIARLVHQRSNQGVGRFVPVNCGSLSLDLAESELFGHTPGAFTGALKEKEGLWEVASGGTLFLDEITEAPQSVLPKLLRVLQDGQVKRLGSNRMNQTHVRVIAASNRDMRTEIQAGRFRADLYHRLSLHQLHIPPLRERPEDIPLIVEHLSHRHFTKRVRFTQEAMDMLMTYDFPGNVRELENIVRGAARRAPDGIVYAFDLASYVKMMQVHNTAQRAGLNEMAMAAQEDSLNASANLSGEGLNEQVRRFTLQVVRQALAQHNHNVSETARALKISRPSLYKILRDIEREGEPHYGERAASGANAYAFAAGVD